MRLEGGKKKMSGRKACVTTKGFSPWKKEKKNPSPARRGKERRDKGSAGGKKN